jgi:hypothetical protein
LARAPVRLQLQDFQIRIPTRARTPAPVLFNRIREVFRETFREPIREFFREVFREET